MIRCDIYEEGKEDEERVGGFASTFCFNTLPNNGDTLWLMWKNPDNELATDIQKAYEVVFSAQWCPNYIDHNTGYLIVRPIKELK